MLYVAEDGALAVIGEAPAHPLLRDVHEVIRSAPDRHDAEGWLEQFPRRLKPLRGRLLQGLVGRGVLSEERSKVFGILSHTRFPTADPAPEAQLRQRLVEVLVAGRAPSPDEALLLGLIEPVGLVDRLVPEDARMRARQRAEDLGERGMVGTGVGDVVRQLQLAVGIGGVFLPGASN